MNSVCLTGNLTRDPEVRTVEANGRPTSVVNFTVATSRFFKRADGQKDKDTTFIPCEAWDTGAETIGKIFLKGDPILIEGSIKEERWEAEGNKRSRLKLRVNRFEKLYRAPKREVVSESAVDDLEDDDDQDTPF